MVTDVKPTHPQKALTPIEVIEFGMVYAPCFPSGYFTSTVLVLLNKTPFSELYAVLTLLTSKEVKPVQPEKAATIDVTDSGIVTDIKPVQPEKAPLSIDVTEFGIIIDVKPAHPEKALLPIEVTEFGMVTDVKPVQ